MEKRLVELMNEQDYVNAKPILEKHAANVLVKLVEKKKQEYTESMKNKFGKKYKKEILE